MLFDIFLKDSRIQEKISYIKLCMLRVSVILVFAGLIFNSIIYANQVYLKNSLEYQATQNIVVRMIDRIEQTDGYVVDQTPVVIIGSLEDSVFSMERSIFDSTINQGVGLNSNFSVGSYSNFYAYFNRILAYPINMVTDIDQIDEWEQRVEVKGMPAFPAEGSCKIIENVLVIKLS